ncbi:hypothetical protein [Proteus sp. ZN5]|uniref:hypothetical protein n=1 Tax=Proteus sp. ZN5 TaxID=2697019 RepID=UPI0013E0EFD3|nr:hypothetical protein [Proteus sp. ZN5]QIG05785.1 hypothetical protein GTK47_10815 [Proteus sp. ZN5]
MMSSSVHYISIKETTVIRYHRQLANSKKQFKQWKALVEQLTYQDERVSQIESTFNALVKDNQQLDALDAHSVSRLTEKLGQFIAPLRQDMKNLREQVIEEKALARHIQQGKQKSSGLLRQLKSQLASYSVLNAEIELSENMSEKEISLLLFRVTGEIEAQQAQLSPIQSELLTQLKAQSTYSQQLWQSGESQSPFTQQCHQIELMIEKLRLVGNEVEANHHANQLIEIQKISDSKKQRLLADSMIMNMAESLRNSIRRIDLMEELIRLCAELESFDDKEMLTLSRDTEAIASLATVEQLDVMIAKLKHAIETHEQQLSMRQQCEAVLAGLSELGYVVHENAVNSWLDNGQVVVSHATIPDYGLELGGKQARFQARTVALTHQRDTTRDKDVDAIWCSQQQQLQTILAKSHAELLIERALPAGQSAMKVIESEDIAHQHTVTQVQKPKTFSR